MNVRATDLIVLHHLRKNARMKHTDLARKLGWPVSTTHERVERCLRKFVIRPVSLLDNHLLGYGVRTLWLVRPKPGMKNRWEKDIRTLPELNTISRLHSGEFLLESITRSRNDEAELEEFLRQEGTIIGSFPVLETLCVEKFLGQPEYLPEKITLAAKPAAKTPVSP